MKILIDTKNIAVFGSGISAFIKPILEHWIKSRPDTHFYLTGPFFDYKAYFNLESESNYEISHVSFPYFLPKFLRHPFYDNILFPNAVKKIKPDFIFSPYHDVRLSKSVPSVMAIHDTCLKDLPTIYPLKVRAYYEHMLKLNLARVKEIITVSEASKIAICERYNYPAHKVNVVYNTIDQAFLTKDTSSKTNLDSFDILYTGGHEYRKNIERLIDALEILQSKHQLVRLLITGGNEIAWQKSLLGRTDQVKEVVHFLGKLTISELSRAYANADVVIYPSLCEGFGRSCLEAMATGTPIACSDLPALREVSSDYAEFFNPYSSIDIAEKVAIAKSRGRKQPQIDSRFTQTAVNAKFSNHLNRIVHDYTNGI